MGWKHFVQVPPLGCVDTAAGSNQARCEKRAPDITVDRTSTAETGVSRLITDPSSARRGARRVGAGALVVLASAVPAPAATAACAGAGDVPAQGAGEQAAAATVCVLNEERAGRGLPRLRSQGQLEQAAETHARDMVRRRYFSHTTPEGTVFSTRLRAYTRGFRWAVGETLAWGRMSRSTPAAIVRAWLNSPPHRRVVLDERYREIGIGVAHGLPLSGDPGATYAAELGVRR